MNIDRMEFPVEIETDPANSRTLDDWTVPDCTWLFTLRRLCRRWQPVLYYRYAFFEGDNPNTAANENFNPLFPAFNDWGSWWQGEIAGEWFLRHLGEVKILNMPWCFFHSINDRGVCTAFCGTTGYRV